MRLDGIVSLPVQQFRQAPYMICDSRFHRRSHPQTGMNLDEVVIGEMQSNGGLVVLKLFVKGVR